MTGFANNKPLRLLAAALLLALSACAAATRIKGAWVDPEYRGSGLQKVLVLGVAENQTYLRVFEDALSARLTQRGVRAEPGYAMFPEQRRPAEEVIAREIADQGFDAMIISRVTGKSTEEVYYPGETYYRRNPYFMPPLRSRYWYDYYSGSYEIVHEPGYVRRYKIVTVQSNVYDARSEKLIWSAVSETVVDGDIESAINSLVDTLVGELAAMGLI